LISVWGGPSHYVAPLGLAASLRNHGAEIAFLGTASAYEYERVTSAGFEFFHLPRVDEIDGRIDTLLEDVNDIRYRADSGVTPPPAVHNGARQVIQLRLGDAVTARLPGVRTIFDQVRPDLVVWDPTEATAPTVAAERGIQHLCLSFVVRPRASSGDWWCVYMERWYELMTRTRVAGPVHNRFGDELSFVPPRYAQERAAPGLRTTHVVIEPNESMFVAEPPPVDARTALVILSTAHKEPESTIEQLVHHLTRAAYTPVIVTSASHGASVFRRLGVATVDSVQVSELAPRAGLIVCCAGINTILTALDHGARLVCVPTRIHSYWEAYPASAQGALVVPADELDRHDLSESIASLRACHIDRSDGASPAAAVAEALVDAAH
jgi:hypothetical protein